MSFSSTCRSIKKLIRHHQWIKNILVFVPLLLANQWAESGKALAGVLSFIAFSLVASAVYALNDVLDREADRAHPAKKHRPIASGALSPSTGLLISGLLLAGSLALSLLALPFGFFVVLTGYFLANLAYSFWFKHVAIFDVILLTLMYVIRIVAGGEGTGVPVSEWLLTLSFFLFLSLALGKRAQELLKNQETGIQTSKSRGYLPEDLHIVRSLGLGSALMTVLVIALYIQQQVPGELYQSPGLLWINAPLLFYGLARFWIHVGRGSMRHDPVLFVLRDWPSHLVFLMIVLVVLLAHRI